MKPELLRRFIERKKGVENCIRLLNTPTLAGTMIALDFVRLVRAAHSQEEDDEEDWELIQSLEFQKMLLAAFQMRDYEEVEKYIMRVLNLPEEMEDVEHTKRVVEPSQFAGVFKSQYNGPAAAELHQHLGELHSEFVSHEGRYYAKYCSIVQSSGTGKSRTLIELKNQGVIVVYINLCSKDEGGNPFPNRDDVPARILTENLEDCLEKEYSQRCRAILTALLQLLKLYLLKLRKEGDTREEIVKAWSEGMCDMGSDTRSMFFADVDKAYKEVMQGRTVSLAASTAELNATDKQLARKEYLALSMTPSSSAELARKEASPDPQQNPQQTLQKVPNNPPRVHSAIAMRNAYAELIAALPEIFETSSNSPSVVVAIDEAHLLCERQGPFSPSHTLTEVISTLSIYAPRIPLWFVFASTASKVADLSAPADLCSSSRVPIGGKRLFPPYYQFGWDQLSLGWRDVEPENVAQFAHIAQIGRPL
ncbi:hypothetical protein FRC06_009499 [Ceratobasidium sp. 370]|nr:hypothetical protein FRC06_009499 [Ceratobasidium sp. 370]